jgi:hypothetical protein
VLDQVPGLCGYRCGIEAAGKEGHSDCLHD